MSANGSSWGRRDAEYRSVVDRAQDAQHVADGFAIEAWNVQLHHRGTAQPSPTIGAAINSGYRYLRVTCSGCRQDAFIDLEAVKRPPTTPVWQLEGSLACSACRDLNRRAPRATLDRLVRDKRAEVPIKIERLRYTVDVFDAGGNLTAVLARVGELDIAKVAWSAAAKAHPTMLVYLRDGGRVLARSDEISGA